MFGNRIVDFRKKKKLKQNDLANILNVTAGAVSQWEHNRTMPDSAMLPRLARALGTSVSELMNETIEQQDPQPQKPEVKEFIALAESLTPQSRQLALTYLQALHDAEHANTPKP